MKTKQVVDGGACDALESAIADLAPSVPRRPRAAHPSLQPHCAGSAPTSPPSPPICSLALSLAGALSLALSLVLSLSRTLSRLVPS